MIEGTRAMLEEMRDRLIADRDDPDMQPSLADVLRHLDRVERTLGQLPGRDEQTMDDSVVIETTVHGSSKRSFLHGDLISSPLRSVLVACKETKTPSGLGHLNQIGQYALLQSTAVPWAYAANILLDQAVALGGDALFLDDDVTLTADSLTGVRQYYDHADIFGLDLHALDGARQVGARHTWDGQVLHDWVEPGPAYVAHVSTSAVYIKHSVLAAGIRFPVWDGVHWEDVALCLEAWRQGFKVLAVPGLVHHAIEGGVGATKRRTPEFWGRWGANKAAFQAWCAERELSAVPREAVGV